jgi:cold shock protein
MHTGTVKWFDVKKGFGFIINPEGKDVFVHFSSIEGDGFRTLKDGDQVEYEEVDSGKGLAARNVKRVKATVGAGAGAPVPNMPPGLEEPGNRDFLH